MLLTEIVSQHNHAALTLTYCFQLTNTLRHPTKTCFYATNCLLEFSKTFIISLVSVGLFRSGNSTTKCFYINTCVGVRGWDTSLFPFLDFFVYLWAECEMK